MSLGDFILGAAIVLGLGAYWYDWRLDRAPEFCTVPSHATYAPQGLLWLDEEMEQTTWWGDGAIIQSTH